MGCSFDTATTTTTATATTKIINIIFPILHIFSFYIEDNFNAKFYQLFNNGNNFNIEYVKNKTVYKTYVNNDSLQDVEYQEKQENQIWL